MSCWVCPQRTVTSSRPAVEPVLTTTNADELRTALAGLTALLSDLIAGKRERPADDLLTALIGVSDDGDQLSEDELLATAYLLILAGYETTVNLIGNGILALLRNPAQLASLRANPSGLPNAVEEFLRFESPLNIATTRLPPFRSGSVRSRYRLTSSS